MKKKAEKRVKGDLVRNGDGFLCVIVDNQDDGKSYLWKLCFAEPGAHSLSPFTKGTQVSFIRHLILLDEARDLQKDFGRALREEPSALDITQDFVVGESIALV